MGPALLIDGKNTAYRAIFAGRGNEEFMKNEYHPFVIWMRFVRMWIEKFKPSQIHVFWDCPKADVWRKKVLPEYKDNRDDNPHTAEISDMLKRLEVTALDILPHLNVRLYIRDGQEADDLIYTACRLVTPEKAIVVSSDSDMIQLPWYMPNISCYEPRLNKIVDKPELNPVMQKALIGDPTDNIDGYRGIGEVKSANLLRDPKAMIEFLGVRGDKIYKRNLALIDLSLNPHRISNELYVYKVMAADTVFDKDAIQKCIMAHKIKGLTQEYSRSILPFKNLKAD